MNKQKRVSSKDVAREAGVSQATVSYVLNNVEGVKIKPETREAVLKAAEKLKYHPNLIAKSMRLRKSMSIGVVSDKSISSFMLMNVLEGIKDGLVSRNYSVTLCVNKSDDIENAEYINYYRSNRIDGIIFVFATLSDEELNYLNENNIPFVIIHTRARKETSHLVRTNMYKAVHKAVSYLKDKYNSPVAYFGTTALQTEYRKYTNYLRALNECGIPFDESLVLKFISNEDKVYEILQQYLDQRKEIPRAILCDSPYLNFSIFQAFSKMGIRVPEDTAMVAIGTSNYSTYTCPPLSAIEAPLYDMGQKGCDLLFNIMENNICEYEDIVVLEWDFINRESC